MVGLQVHGMQSEWCDLWCYVLLCLWMQQIMLLGHLSVVQVYGLIICWVLGICLWEHMIYLCLLCHVGRLMFVSVHCAFAVAWCRGRICIVLCWRSLLTVWIQYCLVCWVLFECCLCSCVLIFLSLGLGRMYCLYFHLELGMNICHLWCQVLVGFYLCCANLVFFILDTLINSLSKDTNVIEVISNLLDTSWANHLSLFSYLTTSLNWTVFIFVISFWIQCNVKSGMKWRRVLLIKWKCLLFNVYQKLCSVINLFL